MKLAVRMGGIMNLKFMDIEPKCVTLVVISLCQTEPHPETWQSCVAMVTKGKWSQIWHFIVFLVLFMWNNEF